MFTNRLYRCAFVTILIKRRVTQSVSGHWVVFTKEINILFLSVLRHVVSKVKRERKLKPTVSETAGLWMNSWLLFFIMLNNNNNNNNIFSAPSRTHNSFTSFVLCCHGSVQQWAMHASILQQHTFIVILQPRGWIETETTERKVNTAYNTHFYNYNCNYKHNTQHYSSYLQPTKINSNKSLLCFINK